jgi:hypothetical protein
VALRIQKWLAEQTLSLSAPVEPPLRAELFNSDQLAQHASTLAGTYEITASMGSNRLLDVLE